MRDMLITFVVEMRVVSGYVDPMRYQSKYCGRPSLKGLTKFVEDYNAALLPDGVNAHVGVGATCTAARLIDQRDKSVIAEWGTKW